MRIVPSYEYAITGFIFGIIFTTDLFGIIWVLAQLKKKKPKKEIYSDLPRVYRWSDRRSK